MRPRWRTPATALAVCLVSTAIAVLGGASPAPVVRAATAPTAGLPTQAAPVTYEVAVPNGGFETPSIPAGTDRLRPANANWAFIDRAGVSRAGSPLSVGLPAAPEGDQAGFLVNSSKVVQQVWVEPGDQIRFRAVQTGGPRDGLLGLAVAIDGVRQGATIVPADGSWSTHTVALSVASARRVFLEVRGLSTALTQQRAALIDDLVVVRRADAIPDAGLPALSQRGIMNTRPTVLDGGVLGVLHEGDSEALVNTPVQAFAEWGSWIFVGGKFESVQRGAGGAVVAQPYLAAFDRRTGAWVPGFRPVLDGTVWDLLVVDGTLYVAGQFTNVNGATRAAGLTALDPATGEVRAGWRATLGLRNATIRPFARALDVAGQTLTVGGRFDSVTGPSGTSVPMSNLARVTLASGAPVTGFTPAINGQVYDVDVAGSRTYAAGKFTVVNGENRRGLAIVATATGASIPGMQQLLFSAEDPRLQYQQAVHAYGSTVWVGGSQHHTQLYDAADLGRIRSFVSNPQGDIQAFAQVNGYLYSGSHANPGTYEYTNGTHFQTLDGWTTRDPVRWIAAYDLTTRMYVPNWMPAIGTHDGEGAWELFVDSQSCLWAGGDFKRGAFVAGVANYAQGFVKFCPVDTVAPQPPTSVSARLTGAGVALAWTAGSDDRAGGLRYDVFRNDRMVAQNLALREFVDAGGATGDRYFVRTRDLGGNLSATTTVTVVPPDTTPPKTPQNLTVTVSGGTATLSWTAPTDNVGVTGYLVYDNPDLLQRTTSTSLVLTLDPGSYSFAVRAEDAAGNQSLKTSPVNIVIT